MTLIARKRTLSRVEMLERVVGLAVAPDEKVRSFYLPPLMPRAELENDVNILREPPDIIKKLTGIIMRSKTGAVIIWGIRQKLLIIPPFTLSEKPIINSNAVEQLHTLLKQDHLIALVLIRFGSYAIGVYRGEKRLGSKVGTGLVHGRHRQGGSSAHRFERHRDKQIEYFLTRVCQHAREQVEPYIKSMNYIVYGGARTTIQLLQKQCPLLEKLETPTLPPLLDIPEPRQAVLEEAIKRVWLSTVYEWQED